MLFKRHIFTPLLVFLLALLTPAMTVAAPEMVQRRMKLCDGIEATVELVTSPFQKRQDLEVLNFAFTGARESCARLGNRNAGHETEQLNTHAGEGPIPVGLDLQYLLPRIVRLAQLTAGSFDPTAWSGKKNISYQDIWFDGMGRRAMIKRRGGALSFRGIIRGYLADRIAARLHKRGVDRFLITVDGLAVRGSGRAAQSSWMAGIPDPVRRSTQSICRVALGDEAIVTVGDYPWEPGEESFPGTAAYASVSVLAADGTTANALANAAMVMGPTITAIFDRASIIGAVFVTHLGRVSTYGNVPAACLTY